MRIGEVNSENQQAVASLFGKLTVDQMARYASRYTPDPAIKFIAPDFSQILTKSEPAMSESEFEIAITEQARKDFSSGKSRISNEFWDLYNKYIQVVSPDRQAIYENVMQKTGGYMPEGRMFFAGNAEPVLEHHFELGWVTYLTEKELARSKQFMNIYNAERSRLHDAAPVVAASTNIIDVKV